LRHRECGKSDQAAKSQLKSDRTSCTSANANQMRLFLHTAAHWLKLTVREAIPEKHALAKAAFTTLRLALLKSARFRETTHRARIAFETACPHAELIRDVFDVFGLKRPKNAPRPPDRRGAYAAHQIHRPQPSWSSPSIAKNQLLRHIDDARLGFSALELSYSLDRSELCGLVGRLCRCES
jgi:hypothetical protein